MYDKDKLKITLLELMKTVTDFTYDVMNGWYSDEMMWNEAMGIVQTLRGIKKEIEAPLNFNHYQIPVFYETRALEDMVYILDSFYNDEENYELFINLNRLYMTMNSFCFYCLGETI